MCRFKKIVAMALAIVFVVALARPVWRSGTKI